MSVRFGLAFDFRNPARWRRPWSELFATLLDEIVFAEELGFDSVWITEHHFVEDGYCPAPLTVLAAIAARTRRIQLSTDVLLLPLYNAVHLAEEVATLDVLSGGRMMLGLGMGYRDEEFAAFGTSRRERVSRTEEGIDVLRGAWTPEPFSYAGKHYRLNNVSVTPKPLQQPPLWLATMSEAAARRAARMDLHLLPQGDRRASYVPWLDELGRLGKNPADFRIGLIKPWLVADGRDDPLWLEIRAHERERWVSYRPWLAAGGFPALPAGEPEPIDQSFMVGSPAEIVDQLSRFRETLPITEVINWGAPFGVDPAEPAVRRSLERFAAEVMPHFRVRV